jgi:mRNA-degrading endonuclease RelE of RelBE toxin-antitoxin system
LRRIVFSLEAKTELRAIPQHIAMNILTALHRLAEHGVGDVRELKGKAGEKRLRVGDYRIRFTDEGQDTLRVHAVKNRKDAYR